MQATSQKGNPKLAVAYIRVSTDLEKQANGAQAQKAAIEEWATREGVTILEWHVETVSGGFALDRRPVLLAAIASVATLGAGRLVVQRIDRFSRDVVSAALAESSLRKSGACLATADGAGSGDDASSELIRGILLHVAKFEKSLIVARIRSALLQKRVRGERLGAPRFGTRVVDGKVVENPAEQATKARLREMRASGLKLREILAKAHVSVCRIKGPPEGLFLQIMGPPRLQIMGPPARGETADRFADHGTTPFADHGTT